MCFTTFVLSVLRLIIQTQNRRPNNIQKTSTQSYKNPIKLLACPGLVLNRALNKLRFSAWLNLYVIEPSPSFISKTLNGDILSLGNSFEITQ